MKSPKILNKKELDKRKAEVYKMIKHQELNDRDEKRLKIQAKREVKLLHEQFKKNNNIKEEPLYDPKVLFNELIDFVNDKNV
tara:strand:+ start:36938 stop:37183 length:246 start_codon:yes stop_codon:yes gene_type:complete